MSLITKKALGASIMELLKNKSLDKVTVKDIVDDCGVNRKTFYYHFHGIIDLLKWTIKSDLRKVVGDNITSETWIKGFQSTMDYFQHNADIMKNLYNSSYWPEIYAFFTELSYERVNMLIEERRQTINANVDIEDIIRITNFFRIIAMGALEEWFLSGMQETPEVFIKNYLKLIEGGIVKALKSFEK